MATKNDTEYRKRFMQQYRHFFYEAWKVSRFNPSMGTRWLRIFFRQRRMQKRRRKAESEGLMIPPVLIFSATGRCNLHCSGCYAAGTDLTGQNELPDSRIRSLFREASELGCGAVLIAGGEPLMRPGVLEAAAGQPDIIFPVFTNGTLLDSESISYFKKHRNLIPVLSIEGNRQHTDTRRGRGIYAMLGKKMLDLNQAKQMFGISVTLTRDNFGEVTHPVWIHEQYSRGCSLFFMVEYVPRSEAEMERCLTEDQKDLLRSRIEKLRKRVPALFLCLPGDEDRYGGCLAAGRGFIHISTGGNLEPCPFAPYSDTNIREISLREGLQSPFIAQIRRSHQLPGEARGGCTLWENRERIQEMLPDRRVVSAS
jgi:MoaA/NifB/PqqE/SkfB family radical SAM enzyme